MELTKINKRLNRLTFVNILILIFIVVFSLNRPPAFIQNVTQQAKDGANGSNGTNGINGTNAVSFLKTVTLEKQLPPINGQDAQPCTTFNNDAGDLVNQCPNGTMAVLKQPLNGENGVDGRTIQFQTDQNTCNIQFKYEDSRTWGNFFNLKDPDCVAQNG